MMSEIEKHYASGYEDARLRTGSGQLERERVRELLARFLPPPPAVLVDVGGGTGAHALWLARQGYAVHLLDVVPLHVELAGEASAAQPDAPLREAVVGDARRLPWPAATADAALLFGPLYHLTALEDRLRAIGEAHRVLKPGGLILAAAISRFASVLDGLREGFLADPGFAAIVDGDLTNGQHRNPTGKAEYFVDAFFHHPGELAAEVSVGGFEVVGVFGVEGPGWLVRNFDDWWGDPERQGRLLHIARRLEEEPSLLGISAHLVAVGRKR